MVGEKTNKKKISITIKDENFNRVSDIVKKNPKETISSVIDYSLDMSLAEVSALIDYSSKNQYEMEQKILESKLAEIKELRKVMDNKTKEGGSNK